MICLPPICFFNSEPKYRCFVIEFPPHPSHFELLPSQRPLPLPQSRCRMAINQQHSFQRTSLQSSEPAYLHMYPGFILCSSSLPTKMNYCTVASYASRARSRNTLLFCCAAVLLCFCAANLWHERIKGSLN